MNYPDQSFLRTDVTAVKLIQNCILAGIGSWIHVFHKESCQLIQKIKVLRGQKVYGISSLNANYVLVYGGKQFAVTKIHTNKCNVNLNITLATTTICDDWLHSATWLDTNKVALLTAHNVVEIWNTSPNLVSRHPSGDNSILYSGLLVKLDDGLLVFAGTVFSEILIRLCDNYDDKCLHRLQGHRGVIFSISCDLKTKIIVTTSDDRSMRIWSTNDANKVGNEADSKEYWLKANITCKYEVYGHTARVMRSYITSSYIISVGEDAAICYWSHQGVMEKKLFSHQNGCIWCVDSDNNIVVTGGGDGGVTIHPLTSKGVVESIIDIGEIIPKKIVFTARNNMLGLVTNENDQLIYYDFDLNALVNKFDLKHESTYKLLELSSCKQIAAVVDMNGNLDIFTENCKGEPTLKHIVKEKLNLGRILSMQWAGNRYLVFCNESGEITVLASKGIEIEEYAKFVLPLCKERWLTAATIDENRKVFVFGDRCGNVHMYLVQQKYPITTFSKVHGRYGPTSLTIKTNTLITTGRSGSVKYFQYRDNSFKLKSVTAFNFEWIEKFLDRSENIICGFQERIFVVHDIECNSRLLELNCGGGHRSWDAIRYKEILSDKVEEFIKFIYLKNSEVQIATFQLSKVSSKIIVNGSQIKEINCLRTVQNVLDKNVTYFITGGEDTTLRISAYRQDVNSRNFNDQVVFKHLSSIRTLKILDHRNKIILLSAGGRAQICVKVVQFVFKNNELIASAEDVIDYLIKGVEKERKCNKNWKDADIDFDPETRIMDTEIVPVSDDEFIIFVACSDAILRIFKLSLKLKAAIELLRENSYHKTCILKTKLFNFAEKGLLITCTTRGYVAFWDVRTIIGNNNDVPIFVMKTNKSGINSISIKSISDTSMIVATGGDDNCIHLIVLEYNNDKINIVLKTNLNSFHCSQITGLEFIDDDLLLSTSIDQRVTLSKWDMKENLSLVFLSQVYTDISDVQGLDVVQNCSDSVSLCVYGKGLEVLQVKKPR